MIIDKSKISIRPEKVTEYETVNELIYVAFSEQHGKETGNFMKNHHGEYGILTMKEIDELDKYRAAYTLFSKLKKAEERADKEGWIAADELEKELGAAD